MGSDEEDYPTTGYGEEDLDEEDKDESEEDHTLQNQHADEDDVDLIDDEEDDEEEDDSMSSAAGEVTIAVAGIPNVTTTVAAAPTAATTTTTSVVRSDAIVEVKKPVALDDSRRLFQRLWTDEDEIELLQGFLDYTTQRGTNNSSHHHHDTAAFYDQIKGKLQLDFNKNQLVEKLRRLKKKYRNVLSKISSGKEYLFKSPHDQATFDISCKIWSGVAATTSSIPIAADGGGIDDEEPHNPNPNLTFNLNEHNGNDMVDPNSSEKKVPRPRKRSRSTGVKIEENYNQQQQYGPAVGLGTPNASNAAVPNVVEETVKSCLLPLFKELVNNFPNGARGSSRGLGLGGMNINPFDASMNFAIGDMTDDKWRKQHMLELEVYSKRLELMQDQIKSRLDELRSLGS